MEWDRAADLRAELDFRSLYDDLSDAVVAAHEEADSRVLSFALEHDVDTAEVWGLIREEASQRGDDTVEFIAERPVAGGSSDSSAGESLAAAALMAGGVWVWSKWSNRRR